MTAILFSGAAYLVGSVNFSILFFKLLKKGDPREQFSGNPGVTNVYRQAGMGAAVLVLILDVGRAVAVAFAGMAFLSPPGLAWAGLALIAGNRYPCFHGFRGGKGVANYLGFSAAVAPMGAVFGAPAWGLVFWLSRLPFIASFAMVVCLAGASILKWQEFPLAVAGAAATLFFIVFNHRSNMLALWCSRRGERNE